MIGLGIGVGRRRKKSAGGSGGGSPLVPFNSRIVYLGDSLIANAPMRSVRQEAQRMINSVLRPGVGANQGIGGNTLAQMLARIDQTIAQKPALVVFNGGTNDLAASRSLAAMQADDDAIISSLLIAGVSKIVRWTIPRSTSITGLNETKRIDFNTWLKTQPNRIIVDMETIFDPTTADSYDGTHPSRIGAIKMALAETAVTTPLIASGSILFADAAAATAAGNIEPNWDFSGNIAGIATGWNITNNAGATVTPSKSTLDGFPAQQIDITGAATSQSTIRLFNTVALSPNFQPGEFCDAWVDLEITSTSGGTPVGLRGLVVQAGSIGNWGSSNPDASAGLAAEAIRGVFRIEPIGLSAVAGSISFEVTVQVPVGAVDIRIKAARMGFIKSETVAYSIPLPITSGKTVPRITGTAIVGNTLTAENQTWAGGAIVYSYQWQRSTVDISGATSRTYVVQVGDSGSTIRCIITGTNASGSSSYTTANTALVP